MRIEFDIEKEEKNLRKHGLSLAASAQLDFANAFIIPDDRQDYGEIRVRAYGRIGDRLHVLAFTVRGDILRAISFRKANKREEARYGIRHEGR